MAEILENKRLFDFGPYRLDAQARVLFRDRTIVPLTPKVLDTLVVLVEHRGAIVSKEDLIKAVWPDSFVEESNLSQNVSVLRKALGHDPDNLTYIETLSKRGYRFTAEVLIPEVEIPPTLPEVVGKPSAAQPADAERASTPPPPATGSRMRAAAAVTAALILCGAVAIWYYRQPDARVSVVRSIAVLPLKNLSGDSGQDYFADGMTELLTAEISKALRLRVASRTSAMRYRNSDKPLRAMARELNVDALIEGSVVRSGGRLRITVQLIHVASDRHLWAETYDRELTDALVLQQEIARAVAHEIRASTAPVSGNRSARISPSAFEAYLRARYYLDQRTADSIPTAVSWYQKAIADDPAYARAYAGLADCYNQLGTVMIGGWSPSESRKMAIAAANRALEIDPELAEAHAALGYSSLYDWNWDRARESLERAIALNPNYAPAHLWLAHYLAARAQFDQALQEVRLARDLDPLSPIIQTQVGWILKFAGRPSESIVEFRRALEMEPGYQWAMWQLGGALMAARDYRGAIQVLQEALERNRAPSGLATLGHVYALAGERRKAKKVLEELLALSRQRYVPPQCFVDVYWGLRDRDKVFEWLEESYRERSNSLLWLGISADMDWLRSDPRLDNLLRRIGWK
ncbi:MAG: winged helix-turn-helix domain-containing protein [Acidobacteriia bacterium]|nr:winged helix-turn-helix domain-containing protein [Terriglobia bacterium]